MAETVERVHTHTHTHTHTHGSLINTEKRFIYKTNNGITLVALVITIIVMLLLSVVSINLIQNLGLIEKVKLAKEEHRASTIQEQKELFEKEIEISKYEGSTPKTINDLLNKLEEEKLITEEEKNTIMQTGRVTIGSKKIIFDTIILPEGYTRCEYLESTGTQYIDTGYIPTINTDIKTRASSQYNAGSIPVALFGYLSGSNPYNRYAIQYHKNFIYCAKGNTEASNDTIDYTKMCDIETQGNKYIYDGIEMSVEPLDFSVSNNLSIILFARQTTNVNRHSKSKIEFFKIYENGVLVQYLIPCLDNNGTPCMYDTVSGKTFYNQGTGEFIAGPVVE